MMRIMVLVSAALLALSAPAAVAEEKRAAAPEALQEAADLAARLVEKLTQAMQGAVDAFPYEAPEITEDGDIVIRRKPAAPPAEPPASARRGPIQTAI